MRIVFYSLLRRQVKNSIFHPPLASPIKGGESWNHSLSGGAGDEIPPRKALQHMQRNRIPAIKPGNDEGKRPDCPLLRSQVKVSIFHPPLAPPVKGGESWNHSLSGEEGDYPLRAAPSG